MKIYSFGVIPVYKNASGRMRFLLVQHHKGHTFRFGADDGHWAFPKGHKKKGEKDLSAALRELKEETGIERIDIIKQPTFVENYSFAVRGVPTDKTVTYYIGMVDDMAVTLQAEELQDYAWVSYSAGLKLITFQESRKLFRQAHKFLLQYNKTSN